MLLLETAYRGDIVNLTNVFTIVQEPSKSDASLVCVHAYSTNLAYTEPNAPPKGFVSVLFEGTATHCEAYRAWLKDQVNVPWQSSMFIPNTFDSGAAEETDDTSETETESEETD